MANESISSKTVAKGLTACAIIAASLGTLSAGEYPTMTIGEGNGNYEPGTYTASSAGISSDVTVTCTFNETTITAIEADVSGETPGIGADIGDTMIAKVLENQTSDVDAETGATITSDAFKDAVAKCIAQASGEEVAEEVQTEAPAQEAPAEEAAPAVTADGYTPGSYTAAAAGISSDVTVTAVFDENGITEITADVSGETAGLGADIGDELVAQAMEAQSAQIDGVSGCTITSDAFKAALNDCIAAAAGESAEEAAEEATEAPAEEAAPAVLSADAIYQPGTYTASAQGIGNVALTVTFDETSIVSIETDLSEETPEIGGKIGEKMSEEAIKAQSADLGWITGATVTSDAFKAALADCIAQASLEAPAEAETEVSEEATEAPAEEATEAATEAPAEEAAEETTEAPVEEAAPAADAIYTPGTYTASAQGMGNVTLNVTFDETSIVSIEADLSEETPEIGGRIGDKMAEEAIKAQSADIGWIAGATVTSDAYKAALADCIAQASGGIVVESETEMELSTEAAAEVETEAPEEALDEADVEGIYTPGTYTAVEKGIDSDITVTITFDDANILEVIVDVSGETAGLGAEIGDEVVSQIMEAQSAEIDGVSGCTISSDAVKAAAADCIAQAQS